MDVVRAVERGVVEGAWRGKLIGLFTFLTEHEDVLRFDWWANGRDFDQEVWGGELPLRTLAAVIKNLPATSALGRKLDPDQWTVGDHITALAVDALHVANWQRGYNPKKPSKPPKPIHRPGGSAAREQVKQADAEDLRARRLAALRDLQGRG